MLQDVVSAKPLDDYKLYLQFENGVDGIVNLKELIEFTGVFEPLREYSYFLQVEVNPELGTVQWPNEADLDPDVLYSAITGLPIISNGEIELFNERSSNIINAYREWADIIQVRTFHPELSNGSLSLIDGINILESARKIVEAAALSAIEPRAYYQGPRFYQAREYLEKVRIGQTEQGSYIFNIISPLNSKENISNYPLQSEPYERRVVKTLFRALSSLRATSEREEDLTNAVEQGISGNLCNALAAMSGNKDRLSFSFRLLDSLKLELSNDISKEIVLPSQILPKIRQLGKKLRERKSVINKHRLPKIVVEGVKTQSVRLEPTHTQIKGLVVRLEWSGGDQKAKVTIVATIEDEAKEVIVELDKNAYLVAFQANLDQVYITCSGLLVLEEDSLVLKETRGFRIQHK